jgi:hypothetical protein
MQTCLSSWAVYTELIGQNSDVVHTTSNIKIFAHQLMELYDLSGIAKFESVSDSVRHDSDYGTLYDY